MGVGEEGQGLEGYVLGGGGGCWGVGVGGFLLLHLLCLHLAYYVDHCLASWSLY